MDTSSPATFLSAAAASALGYTDTLPPTMFVSVQGVTVDARVSREHFADVCVIGHDYLLLARAQLTVNYVSKSVVIATGDAAG